MLTTTAPKQFHLQNFPPTPPIKPSHYLIVVDDISFPFCNTFLATALSSTFQHTPMALAFYCYTLSLKLMSAVMRSRELFHLAISQFARREGMPYSAFYGHVRHLAPPIRWGMTQANASRRHQSQSHTPCDFPLVVFC